MDFSDNESLRLLISMHKHDPTFQLKDTEIKRLKVALSKKQAQTNVALSSTSVPIPVETASITNENSELALMKQELLCQLNNLAVTINERTQINSVGQIAAMVRWDIKLDAGNKKN